MKLIIDIPEVFYEYCKAQEVAIEIQLAVKNGVLLEDELKKIKEELHRESWTMIGIAQDRQLLDLYEVDKIINDRITELKGEAE